MKNANSNRTLFTTVALPAILGASMGAGLGAFVTTQLGLPTVAWVFWCVNIIGLVLLFVLGTTALAYAVFCTIRNRGSDFTYESACRNDTAMIT